MYSIAEGEAPFLNLVSTFKRKLGYVVDLPSVTAIGLTCSSINGGIAFSAEDRRQAETATRIPAEMAYPGIMTFDSSVSPIKEWSQEYWNDGQLLTQHGEIVQGWRGNREFAQPIFYSICRWMDQAFSQADSMGLRPDWLAVDEVDSGLNHCWRPGHLTAEFL